MHKEDQRLETCRASCPMRGIPSDLPDIMKEVAEVLKANGCSQTLIRAALLSICGVEVRGLSLSALYVC